MSSTSTPSTDCPHVFDLAWRYRVRRGLKEAIFIALCAAFPAFALYCGDGAMHARTLMVQPVPEGTLWIDARPEAEYVRGHVPGALNLNDNNWDKALAQVFATWQPPRPVLVYCSVGCSSAADVAGRLAALGLEPIKVYEGGFEAWNQANASSLN